MTLAQRHPHSSARMKTALCQRPSLQPIPEQRLQEQYQQEQFDMDAQLPRQCSLHHQMGIVHRLDMEPHEGGDHQLYAPSPAGSLDQRLAGGLCQQMLALRRVTPVG